MPCLLAGKEEQRGSMSLGLNPKRYRVATGVEWGKKEGKRPL